MPAKTKKKTNAPAPAAGPGLAKHVRFEMMTIDRAKITAAPYNPRVIDTTARRKLKSNLQKRGLVQPLLWNKRTGHLVAGHQRLEILDEIEGGKAYTLPVSAVDVSEAVERELNVFLNNPAAQGSFDSDRLADALSLPDIDLEALGFDLAELQNLLPDDQRLEALLDESRESAADAAAGLEAMKAQRKGYRERADQADDTEFYVVAVFQDRPQADAFLAGLGKSLESRYIDGTELAGRLKIELPEPAAAVKGAKRSRRSTGL